MTKLIDWTAPFKKLAELLGLKKPPAQTIGTFSSTGTWTTRVSDWTMTVTGQFFCSTFTPLTHYGEPTGDDICDVCGLPSARHPVPSGEYWRGYNDGWADTVDRLQEQK